MIRDFVTWCYEGAPDWVTWIFHGLVAIPLTWGFGPLVVVAFYGLREFEEILREWYARIPHSPSRKKDHFMDAFVPAAVAGLTALVFQWLR